MNGVRRGPGRGGAVGEAQRDITSQTRTCPASPGAMAAGLPAWLIGPASGAPIQLQRRQRRSRAQVGLWPTGRV